MEKKLKNNESVDKSSMYSFIMSINPFVATYLMATDGLTADDLKLKNITPENYAKLINLRPDVSDIIVQKSLAFVLLIFGKSVIPVQYPVVDQTLDLTGFLCFDYFKDIVLGEEDQFLASLNVLPPEQAQIVIRYASRNRDVGRRLVLALERAEIDNPTLTTKLTKLAQDRSIFSKRVNSR